VVASLSLRIWPSLLRKLPDLPFAWPFAEPFACSFSGSGIPARFRSACGDGGCCWEIGDVGVVMKGEGERVGVRVAEFVRRLVG